MTGEIQLAGVDEIQDDVERLGAEDVEGGADGVGQPLGALRQQHAKVAAAGEQDVAVGPEELALHQHAAVTEQLLLPLLVQLLQQAALVRHRDVGGVEPPLRLPGGEDVTKLTLGVGAVTRRRVCAE